MNPKLNQEREKRASIIWKSGVCKNAKVHKYTKLNLKLNKELIIQFNYKSNHGFIRKMGKEKANVIDGGCLYYCIIKVCTLTWTNTYIELSINLIMSWWNARPKTSQEIEILNEGHRIMPCASEQ